MIASIGKGRFALLACVAIGIVAWIYLPIVHAGFVWDDRVFLHDDARWRAGSEWFRSAFATFFDTQNYFRPLAALTLIAQLSAFSASASAMHAFSVALHCCNVLLVGMIARQLSLLIGGRFELTGIVVAMLLYGLHPLLIEPVAWIACQVELLLTFFILLGLQCHLAIRNPYLRGVAVAVCFFLAACSKEAAVSFPLLIAVVDWQLGLLAGPARSIVRQAGTYCALLFAGICYLALRKWGLGYLVTSSGTQALGAPARLQLICETYLTYWKMILWPMDGLNPLHEYPSARAPFSIGQALRDCGALALFAIGVLQLVRRRVVGALIVATTVMLLPMMHVVPVDLDDNLYHDRWAMTAVAIACIFAPATWSTIAIPRLPRAASSTAASIGAAAWLIMAAFNVRVTLPLWSDETRLWLWALRENPDSLIAQDNLLAIYVQNGDLVHARPLAARFMASATECLNCLLNAAQVAILDRDATTADRALLSAQQAMKTQAPSKRQLVSYVSKIGDVRRLRGDFSGAETAYRDAVRLDPMLPASRLSLATMLARQGRIEEARRESDAGLALMAPDVRVKGRREFELFLRSAAQQPRR